jgi:hypothetical protein
MTSHARALALRIAAAAGSTLVACGGSTNTGSTQQTSTGAGGASTGTGGSGTGAGGAGGDSSQGGNTAAGGSVTQGGSGGAGGSTAIGGAGGQGGMPALCYSKSAPGDACMAKTDPMLVPKLTTAANGMLPGGACSINPISDATDSGTTCCYTVQPLLCGGRPLFAGGVARVARRTRRGDWA